MAERLLNAATATGASAVSADHTIMDKHTIAAYLGGTVVATAVTVTLEGSLDNTNWFTLGTKAFSAGELTAEQAILHVVDAPVPFKRTNLTVLTGGTDPTVTVDYEGMKS